MSTPPTGSGRPDVEAELRGLMDFQRLTVDRVHERFWDADDPSRRFLVADEVGLGKTLVARGVIARTIEHLWDDPDRRIDIVYICSNAQIARQNLPKLRVGGGHERHHADRLTLLANQMHHLEGQRVNFVSFTPGTSFNISNSGGWSSERVLLYWLLKKAWTREVRKGPWIRFFRAGAQQASFERQVDGFDRGSISADMGRDFAMSLSRLRGPGGGILADELRECVAEFGRRTTRNGWPDRALGSRRNRLIGALRQALAHAAVERLEPDLVILDEFQRFKSLMNDEDEGARLARALFDHKDARLLLLSATPFKMYTLPDEPEGDDHYKDFVDTVRFLAGADRATSVERDLSDLRSGLLSDDLDRARAARDRAQAELRRVMSRTERLARTPDRDGLVKEETLGGVRLTADDVRDFRRLNAVSEVVGGRDQLEYWRSAPYVLELMESYQVKQKLLKHDLADPALVKAVQTPARGLRWSDVQVYAELDPGNAKLRGLAADVLDSGAWRLAWVPPSLPSYELSGPYADPGLRAFTKRLVFSSWAIAPKAISAVLSYEAERRINEAVDATGNTTTAATHDYESRPTGLLTLQRSDPRLTAMSLLYPSAALAEAGDPLAIARLRETALPLPRELLETEVRTRIEALLSGLPKGPDSGSEDFDWYLAAGLLADRNRGVDDISRLSFGIYDEPDDQTQTGFGDHRDRARHLQAASLGRRPHDLPEVLTQLAIGAPGTAALRALARVSGGVPALLDVEVRDAASSMAWSLRNLFNRPEIMGVVRGTGGRLPYWQDVLRYAVDGGLPSVLEEYAYVLSQGIGLSGTPGQRALSMAQAFDGATSLRTASQSFTDLSVVGGEVRATQHPLRTHLAVRFGRGVSEDDKGAARESQVRDAFNSPFWPFVLSSTSVGQEGLDFHHYSHAIVHWNLPSNPVDLEQREGRVHRYQGHAVRRNVAAAYGSRAEVTSADDPWTTLFALASTDRGEDQNDLYPSWIPPLAGGARIQRYVPALPLSNEQHALRRLLRTVGAYRMVLGQPRQQDLLRYLGDHSGQLEDLMIDLEP